MRLHQSAGGAPGIVGSDSYGACLASNIGKVLGAGLTSEETEQVMRTNMAELLNETAAAGGRVW